MACKMQLGLLVLLYWLETVIGAGTRLRSSQASGKQVSTSVTASLMASLTCPYTYSGFPFQYISCSHTHRVLGSLKGSRRYLSTSSNHHSTCLCHDCRKDTSHSLVQPNRLCGNRSQCYCFGRNLETMVRFGGHPILRA